MAIPQVYIANNPDHANIQPQMLASQNTHFHIILINFKTSVGMLKAAVLLVIIPFWHCSVSSENFHVIQ